MLPEVFQTNPYLKWTKDILQIVIIAIIFYALFMTVFQPHVVNGSSMEPNYQTGEYVLSSRLPVWLNQVGRGAVVIVQSPPTDPGKEYIKRIIGLPGEKIKIINNQVIIYNAAHPNGVALKESYLGSNTLTQGKDFIPENQIVTIPKDDYVVMGDNRNESYDSRAWGFVSKDHIYGQAYAIYWPVPEIGWISGVSY
jgi:signal peptidase I